VLRRGHFLWSSRRKDAGYQASRLMVWTGKQGGFSQTQSRLWVLANSRFVNGYFENKGRKFLSPGNHLRFLGRFFLCEDYPLK